MADVIIAKHVILCGQDPQARVSVFADIERYLRLCEMIMKYPVGERNSFYIKTTSFNQPYMVSKILTIHALSGSNTIAAIYGVGKKTAISAAEDHALTHTGSLEVTLINIEATYFVVWCLHHVNIIINSILLTGQYMRQYITRIIITVSSSKVYRVT